MEIILCPVCRDPFNEDDTIERIEMKDNEIILPSEEGYYIYELNATWDKGKITFLFDVNVK